MAALSVLGVRYALALGLIAGVLELVPFAGPVAPPPSPRSSWPPTALPLRLAPPVSAVVVALVYVGLRQAEDYLVIPQVVGRAVALHPLVALFAVLAGAAVGGVPGMLLGIPGGGRRPGAGAVRPPHPARRRRAEAPAGGLRTAPVTARAGRAPAARRGRAGAGARQGSGRPAPPPH